MIAMSGKKQQESPFFVLRARWKKHSHRNGIHWDLEFSPYMGANNVGTAVFNLSNYMEFLTHIVYNGNVFEINVNKSNFKFWAFLGLFVGFDIKLITKCCLIHFWPKMN